MVKTTQFEDRTHLRLEKGKLDEVRGVLHTGESHGEFFRKAIDAYIVQRQLSHALGRDEPFTPEYLATVRYAVNKALQVQEQQLRGELGGKPKLSSGSKT